VLRADLRGEEGRSEELKLSCPAEHRGGQAPGTIQFRATRSLSAKNSGVRRIAMECLRTQHRLALLVRVRNEVEPIAGIPVVIDGTSRGVTGKDGLAHYSFAGKPGTAMRVVLDTSEQPDLMPSRPEKLLVIGETDEVEIFDQRFSKPPPKKKRRHRHKKREKKPRRPIRID
jgi:hypothetical protein